MILVYNLLSFCWVLRCIKVYCRGIKLSGYYWIERDVLVFLRVRDWRGLGCRDIDIDKDVCIREVSVILSINYDCKVFYEDYIWSLNVVYRLVEVEVVI